jgi:euchromatic histone-lysine N-methyltransferase
MVRRCAEASRHPRAPESRGCYCYASRELKHRCKSSQGRDCVLPHLATAARVPFPVEVFQRSEGFWGVRARGFIPYGSFLCAYVGQIALREETDTQEPQPADAYTWDVGPFQVQPYFSGNVGRFLNHACGGAATLNAVDYVRTRYAELFGPAHFALRVCMRVCVQSTSRVEHVDATPRVPCFFANEDIQPGTELTFDYNWISFDACREVRLTRPEALQNKHLFPPCNCGSSMCRGVMQELIDSRRRKTKEEKR